MADLVREYKRAVSDPEIAALRARIAELEAALRSIYMRLPQEDDDDYTDLHSKICDIIGSVIDVET